MRNPGIWFFIAACFAGSATAQITGAEIEDIYCPYLPKTVDFKRHCSAENRKIIQAMTDPAELKQAAGVRYAGTWIGFDRQNRAYAALALSGRFATDKALAKQYGVKIFYVKYSELQLERVQKEIMDIALKSNELIFSVSINAMTNNLGVRSRKSDFEAARKLLVDAGIRMDMVVQEEQNGPITLY